MLISRFTFFPATVYVDIYTMQCGPMSCGHGSWRTEDAQPHPTLADEGHAMAGLEGLRHEIHSLTPPVTWTLEGNLLPTSCLWVAIVLLIIIIIIPLLDTASLL